MHIDNDRIRIYSLLFADWLGFPNLQLKDSGGLFLIKPAPVIIAAWPKYGASANRNIVNT